MIINLHGKLGQKYGKVHKFKVRNAKDAIDALAGNYKGFKTDIKKLAFKGLFYKAITNKNNVCKNACDYYVKTDVIDLVPSIFGSGFAVVSAITKTAVAEFGVKQFAAAILINVAAAIIIAGIIAVLFPPEVTSQVGQLQTESFIFNNTDNNAVQGFLVPIIYGQVRCGSSIISTNNDAFDVAVERDTSLISAFSTVSQQSGGQTDGTAAIFY